jgi:hypothetical protein
VAVLRRKHPDLPHGISGVGIGNNPAGVFMKRLEVFTALSVRIEIKIFHPMTQDIPESDQT